MKNLEIENSIRYALLIEYNGSDLVGWQKQNEGMSVQSSLEEAAKNIFNQDFDIQGSGRTDAGVHALGQIAHINLPKDHRLTSRHPFYIISAFNSLLRDTNIRVISAKPVKPEFNARFSAIKRFYKYRILCRAAPPGLDNGKVWHFRKKLNISLMEEGVGHLIGRHDFTPTFRRSHSIDVVTLCKCVQKSGLKNGVKSGPHSSQPNNSGTRCVAEVHSRHLRSHMERNSARVAACLCSSSRGRPRPPPRPPW